MSSPKPAARSFRDRLVWRKAHELVLAIYRLTECFPERVSGKRSPAEKARFMNIAEGSPEDHRYLILARTPATPTR